MKTFQGKTHLGDKKLLNLFPHRRTAKKILFDFTFLIFPSHKKGGCSSIKTQKLLIGFGREILERRQEKVTEFFICSEMDMDEKASVQKIQFLEQSLIKNILHNFIFHKHFWVER